MTSKYNMPSSYKWDKAKNTYGINYDGVVSNRLREIISNKIEEYGLALTKIGLHEIVSLIADTELLIVLEKVKENKDDEEICKRIEDDIVRDLKDKIVPFDLSLKEKAKEIEDTFNLELDMNEILFVYSMASSKLEEDLLELENGGTNEEYQKAAEILQSIKNKSYKIMHREIGI